jgi:hypothetical protein
LFSVFFVEVNKPGERGHYQPTLRIRSGALNFVAPEAVAACRLTACGGSQHSCWCWFSEHCCPRRRCSRWPRRSSYCPSAAGLMARIPASWVLWAVRPLQQGPRCANQPARLVRAFGPPPRLPFARISRPAPGSACLRLTSTVKRLRMPWQRAYSAAPLPADRLLPSPLRPRP